MKARLFFCMLFTGLLSFSCEDIAKGVSSLSRLSSVPESEVTTVSYDKIDNRAYVHVELPDTLSDAHTVFVCAYDYDHTDACCASWLFEDAREFWVPYADVENCAVRITCWGRFGVRYITCVW